MQPLIIVIGLCLIGAGSGLSFLGHYDGVLGAADSKLVLSSDVTRDVTARLVVAGTLSEANDQFGVYERQLVIPATMSPVLNAGQWIPVRLEGTDAEAYLKVREQAPAPGTLLVFNGDIQAHWPVYDADTRVLASKPVLFLEPTGFHEPILFKA